MIITPTSLSHLFLGFKTAFQGAFEGAASDWQKLATLITSETSEEVYAWLGQVPNLREWIGDRHIKDLSESDYRIKNKKFESTVRVERDKIEDDRFGIYTPLMMELGRAAAVHPDQLVFELLKAGFASLCYDGQYFFDADHPVGGASVSNSGGGSGTAWYLLDLSRSLKPIIYQRRKPYEFRQITDHNAERVFMRDEYVYGVDGRANVGWGFWQMAYGSKQTLDAAAFNAAYAAMQSFKNDDGRPLGIKPTHLVVPPALRGAALEIVKAERDAYGATNINQGAVELLVTPWLA